MGGKDSLVPVALAVAMPWILVFLALIDFGPSPLGIPASGQEYLVLCFSVPKASTLNVPVLG